MNKYSRLSQERAKSMREVYVMGGLLLAGLVGFFALEATAETYTPTLNATNKAVQPLILSGRSAAGERAPEKISPLVAEIIRLVDAKIAPAVVKAYIQNAPMAYNPTAAELIALQERGVGTEVLMALLQHGAELMARTVPTQLSFQPSGSAPVYRFAPQTAYPTERS